MLDRRIHDGIVAGREHRQRAVGARDFELRALEIVDVGAGAEPFDDRLASVDLRHAADQPPPVRAVGASKPALERECARGRRGVSPRLPRTPAVIRVKRPNPSVPDASLLAQPRVVRPLLIEIDVPGIRPRDPDDLRHRLGERTEFLHAPREGVGGAFALGDVAHGAERRRRAVVGDCPTLHFDIDDSAVQPDELFLNWRNRAPVLGVVCRALPHDVVGERVYDISMSDRPTSSSADVAPSMLTVAGFTYSSVPSRLTEIDSVVHSTSAR